MQLKLVNKIRIGNWVILTQQCHWCTAIQPIALTAVPRESRLVIKEIPLPSNLKNPFHFIICLPIIIILVPPPLTCNYRLALVDLPSLKPSELAWDCKKITWDCCHVKPGGDRGGSQNSLLLARCYYCWLFQLSSKIVGVTQLAHTQSCLKPSLVHEWLASPQTEIVLLFFFLSFFLIFVFPFFLVEKKREESQSWDLFVAGF